MRPCGNVNASNHKVCECERCVGYKGMTRVAGGGKSGVWKEHWSEYCKIKLNKSNQMIRVITTNKEEKKKL